MIVWQFLGNLIGAILDMGFFLYAESRCVLNRFGTLKDHGIFFILVFYGESCGRIIFPCLRWIDWYLKFYYYCGGRGSLGTRTMRPLSIRFVGFVAGLNRNS